MAKFISYFSLLFFVATLSIYGMDEKLVKPAQRSQTIWTASGAIAGFLSYIGKKIYDIKVLNKSHAIPYEVVHEYWEDFFSGMLHERKIISFRTRFLTRSLPLTLIGFGLAYAAHSQTPKGKLLKLNKSMKQHDMQFFNNLNDTDTQETCYKKIDNYFIGSSDPRLTAFTILSTMRNNYLQFDHVLNQLSQSIEKDTLAKQLEIIDKKLHSIGHHLTLIKQDPHWIERLKAQN